MRILKQFGIQICLTLLFLVAGSATAFVLTRPFSAIIPPSPAVEVLNSLVSARPAANSPAAPANAPARLAPISVRASGNLAAVNQASLTFQAAGRVKEIRAKQGDRVKAGTLLALLDTSALDAQVASAESSLAKVKAGPVPEDLLIAKVAVDRAKAAVDQAQAAYDRIGGSSNPGIGASSTSLTLQQATFSHQEALARFNLVLNHPTPQELAAAQATLETAKIAASNARLTAPIDGTILWVSVRVGDSVGVGAGVMVMADLARMQLVLNVDEVSAAALQVGQAATVTIEALPGRPLKGRVSNIAQLGFTGGTLVTVPVTIDLDTTNMPIYPGLSGTAEIQGVTP